MATQGERYLSQRKARGFSLTELAVVLGVIGFILGAIWLAADRAWDYTGREQTQEAVAATVDGVRNYYAGQAGVEAGLATTSLTTKLLSANVIPAYAKGTLQVCNWPLGATTTCPTSSPGTASPLFGVALTGLARKDCVSLVETLSAVTGPSGLIEVDINGVNIAGALGHPIQPVSDSDATTNCLAVADGAGSVTFVYRVSAPSH